MLIAQATLRQNESVCRAKERHAPIGRSQVLQAAIFLSRTVSADLRHTGSGHSVLTHFLFELSRLGWARQGVYIRKKCPICRGAGYPTCRGETARPS